MSIWLRGLKKIFGFLVSSRAGKIGGAIGVVLGIVAGLEGGQLGNIIIFVPFFFILGSGIGKFIGFIVRKIRKGGKDTYSQSGASNSFNKSKEDLDKWLG